MSRNPPPRFTVDDVQHFLKRFGLADALQVINRLSQRVLDQPTVGMTGVIRKPGLTVTQWDLAFIAKQLILCSNDYRSERLSKDGSGRALRHALYLVDNMRDPVLTGSGTATSEEVSRSLVRIAYQQFRYQGWANEALFRIYLIYCKAWGQIPNNPNLDTASHDIYGTDLLTFLAFGMALYSLAQADNFPAFRKTALTNMPDPRLGELRTRLRPDVVDRLWPLVATDYRGFRTLASEHQVDKQYARFEWNPLDARPVILTQNPPGLCVVPSITSLLLRFTDGLFYDYIGYYDGKGNQREFTSGLGKAFELYVGEQLRAHCSGCLVLEERKYKVRGKEWGSADWIVVNGEDALFIECRASRLIQSGKVLADGAVIAEEITRKILPIVRHFSQKTAHIATMPDLWPELSGVKRFYYLVVTNDPWWPPEPFHNILDKALNDIAAPPYHVLSIDALEDLLSYAAAGLAIPQLLQGRIERGQQGWYFGDELTEQARVQGLDVHGNRLIQQAKIGLFESIGLGDVIDVPEGSADTHATDG